MKKTVKKLTLSRETLIRLNTSPGKVVGGAAVDGGDDAGSGWFSCGVSHCGTVCM
jgi:hypothetical protein